MATESDKTSTGVVATIVVVGSFAMIAISALIAAMVRAETTELERTRPADADLETVAALDKGQLEKLNAAPHWADQPGGKVAVPIELAMNLVVDEYRKRPEAASPPPPPGLVMPPPAPAAPTAVAGPDGASIAPSAAPASAAASPAPSPAVPNPAAPSPAAPTPAAPSPAAPTPAAPSPAAPTPAAPSPAAPTPAAPTPAAPSPAAPTPAAPSPPAPTGSGSP